MTFQVFALMVGLGGVFVMSKAKSQKVRIVIGLPCIAVMAVVLFGHA